MSQFNNTNPFDNVQIGMDYNNNNSANPFQVPNQQMPQQNFQQYQQPVNQHNNSNYPNENQNYHSNNRYDVEKDRILYEVKDQVISGKNSQNQFTMRIRSYNNTTPKIELVKISVSNNGQQYVKGFRLSREEFEFILNHATEIGQALIQLTSQTKQNIY